MQFRMIKMTIKHIILNVYCIESDSKHQQFSSTPSINIRPTQYLYIMMQYLSMK